MRWVPVVALVLLAGCSVHAAERNRASVPLAARNAAVDEAGSPTATASPMPTRAPVFPTATTFPGSTPTRTPAPDESTRDLFNCSDFESQAAAQWFLRRYPNDPSRLDQNKDGIACESNPPPYDRTPVPR